MSKYLLKKPKLKFEIYDIIQFGSSILLDEKPNDVDIAIIYKETSIKKQLEVSQKIKRELEKQTKLPIHIKSFDLYSLFDKANFSKESILFGVSLLNRDFFAKRFGLLPKIQISYSLKEFEKKTKVRFHYMLKGKKGKGGLLNKYGGGIVKPGLIEISPLHERIFINSIKKILKKFELKKIFVVS